MVERLLGERRRRRGRQRVASADVAVVVVRRCGAAAAAATAAAVLDVVVLVHGHGRQLGGAHGGELWWALGAGVGRRALGLHHPLLQVRVPVVLHLVVCPSRQMHRNLRPPDVCMYVPIHQQNNTVPDIIAVLTAEDFCFSQKFKHIFL